MIFCHHLCGKLGSLKENRDSTRALQSSTSLFVAFITGPRWNIYKTLFASLLKTSNGNNWLQRDATILFWFAYFGSSQQGGTEAEMAGLPFVDSQETISHRDKYQSKWKQEISGWAGTKSQLELQCHFTAPLLSHALLLWCFTQSSFGDLHPCLSIQRLNVIYTSLLSSLHFSSSSFYT